MTEEVRTHQTMIEMSQSIPLEVEAGTDIILKVKVSCPSGCDLRGRPVKVMAPDGIVMTSELAQYEEKTNETEVFALQAPKEVGEYGWSILFPRHEGESVVHEESSLPISFRTIPHKTSMAVWDVPLPVAMNSSFKVKVGMKCSATCELTGQLIEVCDEAGTKIGEGSLGETPWPETNALYWAEVELAAPATEGVSFWSVQFTAAETELPHEGTSANFSFRTAKPPEHRVTVNVIGKDTQAPVEKVEVRFGIYSAFTDESGLATVELPKGTYELRIWKDGFKAPRRTVEVAEDVTVQVEALTVPTKEELAKDYFGILGNPYEDA